MIRHGRKVITPAQIAARAGVPLRTWRRRDLPQFMQRVPNLNEDGRYQLYDLKQTLAYLDGKPIPALPKGEHPEDLLTDPESAAVLGVEPQTIKDYRSKGYLPGTHPEGPDGPLTQVSVTRRADLLGWVTNRPGQGVGGGRKAGVPQPERRKQRAYEDDTRLSIALAALAANSKLPVTRQLSMSKLAEGLAAECGDHPRTWERIINAATEYPRENCDSGPQAARR